MAKGDVLVRMKADVSNYDANIAKARGTLERFKNENLTLGGVLNQSTKSIVAAAAQYASFAAILGTVASGFAEVMSKGMAMSREAEGVSKAFERLNRPGLLDNLREATHNTVNDLELMKQAVKFDNFNLSLEQMGTFLAFAQQQAKDTGQDINYLVDSIVTGLGRKSLPILDNLGLSAEEIRNRMKETGDMTQAVADIIKDRMKAAGDYIETAADRAAQSQVKLDNAMKELGDTMNSLSGAGATLWNDLKVGAIELANDAIKPLIKLFNELASYINGPTVESILTSGMTDVTSTVDDNGRLIRKDAINGIPETTITGNAPKRTKVGRSGSTVKMPTWDDFARQNFRTNEYISDNLDRVLAERQMPSVWAMFDQEGMKKMLGLNETQTFDLKKDITEKDYKKLLGIKEKDDNQVIDEMQKIFGGVQGIFGGIEQLGIELPEGLKNILSGIQGVMSIVQGITSILLVLETLNEAQTATSFIPFFARGGVLHAANGVVPGHKFSGDNIPALLNAGETVLTAAQTNTLASNLRNGGLGNMNLSATVSGEQIRFVLNSNGRRTGKGEYLQTNFVRS